MDFLSREQATVKAIQQSTADMLLGIALLLSLGRFFNNSTPEEIAIVAEMLYQQATALGIQEHQGV